MKTFLVFRVFSLYLHRDNLLDYVETRDCSKASGGDDCRIGC